MRHLSPILSVGAIFWLASLQAQNPKSIPYAKTITEEDLKRHLQVLASDEYEGRATGEKGQKMAAQYIAEQFKKAGLKSATDPSYYQSYPLVRTAPETADLVVGGKKYEMFKDYYFFPFGKNIEIQTKEILFLGYGISDKNYDDYKGADVKDKVLLVLGGEPMTADSVSVITGTKEVSSWTNNFRKKTDAAREKGAAALLVINVNFDKNVEFMKHYFESSSLKLDDSKKEEKKDPEKKGEKKEERKRIPQAGISIEMADELLKSTGLKSSEIRRKIGETKSSMNFLLPSSCSIIMKNKEEKINAENVLAVVEGSDLKEEVIFITAHYDHLGVQGGKVYNGADDDGSGTVAIIEMAEAFQKAKNEGNGPRRTIVFMAVSGEEKGLLGSSWYTENPIFPIKNTVCNLNIDMIGRTDDIYKDSTDYVYIIGSDKISTDLHKINEAANTQYTRLKLDYRYNDPNDPNRFYYRSDHYNFAKKGVPIIFYFNGTHDDYHEETDEISKINFTIMARRAMLVFYTAWEVANRQDRIVSDVKQENGDKE